MDLISGNIFFEFENVDGETFFSEKCDLIKNGDKKKLKEICFDNSYLDFHHFKKNVIFSCQYFIFCLHSYNLEMARFFLENLPLRQIDTNKACVFFKDRFIYLSTTTYLHCFVKKIKNKKCDKFFEDYQKKQNGKNYVSFVEITFEKNEIDLFNMSNEQILNYYNMLINHINSKKVEHEENKTVIFDEKKELCFGKLIIKSMKFSTELKEVEKISIDEAFNDVPQIFGKGIFEIMD